MKRIAQLAVFLLSASACFGQNHHTDPLNINCHCFDPTTTVVLNPAAWTNVPNGQFAANQSSIRSFRGVRIPQESANFGRNFRIKERYNLSIRVEFTNIFNRLQLPTSTTALGGVNLGNFTLSPTTFPMSSTHAGLLRAFSRISCYELVGQLGKMRLIGNRPGARPVPEQRGYQPRAGCHPAPPAAVRIL